MKFKYNRTYGFYLNRPFRIVTMMKSKRCLTVNRSNVVIANKNNQSSQLWTFNPSTMTIQTQSQGRMSLAMERNGNNNRRGTNLVIQRTNNRAWW